MDAKLVMEWNGMLLVVLACLHSQSSVSHPPVPRGQRVAVQGINGEFTIRLS